MTKFSQYKILYVTFLVMVLLLTACSTIKEDNRNLNKETPIEESPKNNIDLKKTIRYVGDFELPVNGATGYTSISLDLKETANLESNTLLTLNPGTGFEIIKEESDWWYIREGNKYGWLQHKYCFINLPDVIPSIVYDVTNTYSSKFRSSGKDIPNITGSALYEGKSYNERLQKEEYIVPVLYNTAKKVYRSQQNALADGNSLKIYEGFRPYSVQMEVVEQLKLLSAMDMEVEKGINTYPWGITWFITKGVSNHQMGYGVDVGLVKINEMQEIEIGNYVTTSVVSYEEFAMPSPIHELSGTSAIFTTPVSSLSPTDWKNSTYTNSMNEPALMLQVYFASSGFTPLASEWWHFNDLETMEQIKNNKSSGNFILDKIYSQIPS
ncbi:hypothetical protein [Niallia sp. FSL W8-0635]|uniref:hypothetical protein n=1 Tax=Niallia sp. FSL W8-0635 TaxID=2975337 RepID=UPI0009C8F89E|nr:D-alanyl-D-alanine dipeptidase [Mycobacteroides abscessus subsp. abscessus]HEO8418846.1 D-alanyl-D-alanine carboxypeptidase family protein [Yersinia enterocolitica]